MVRFPFAMLFLLWAVPLTAQPGGEFEFHVPLRWTEAAAGQTGHEPNLSATLGLEHVVAREHVRIFYEMNVDAFGAEESLRTWLHSTGMLATWGSRRRAFDLAGAVFWRSNEGAWAEAGFKGVNLLTSFRLQPRAGVTLAASYALYVRGFAEQPALDQVEHFGTARLLANLVTRTTVVGVVSVGQKAYDGGVRTALEQTSLPDQPGAQGRGWRRGLFMPAQVELARTPGARQQWTWAGRVAQSLDERTGIWIEREERRTRGGLPPAIVWTPPLFYEDGVYDDPYVIDAYSWRAGVKHVFATRHEVSAWGSRSERNYSNLVREDLLFRATVETVVPVAGRGRATFDAVARYAFFRNESSDGLESYRAHAVSAGFRVGF